MSCGRGAKRHSRGGGKKKQNHQLIFNRPLFPLVLHSDVSSPTDCTGSTMIPPMDQLNSFPSEATLDSTTLELHSWVSNHSRINEPRILTPMATDMNCLTYPHCHVVPPPPFLLWQSPDIPVMAFPEGLRMLTGDPSNKNLSEIADYTLFVCYLAADFSVSIHFNSFNFNRDCPYGLKTVIRFPPCWDGINLFKTDGTHVSWPVNDHKNDECPWTHPYRMPQIMLEYSWYTSAWAPGKPLAGHLAWANGDTTGGGIHADFTNGWDTAILGQALNTTACTDDSGKEMFFSDCPVFKPYMQSIASGTSCKPEKGILENPMGNADLVPIPRLPGCNPLWGATGPKPTCANPPAPLDISAFKGTTERLALDPSKTLDVYPLPKAPGWSEWQCLNRCNFYNTTSYVDPDMTVERCTTSCLRSGYTWAGLEKSGGWQCSCGTSLHPNAQIVPGRCNAKCPGNTAQTCGDQYQISSWHYNPVAVPITASPRKPTKIGCYQIQGSSADNLIGSATYTTSDMKMTNELCAQLCINRKATWSATSSYYTCKCGDAYGGGVSASGLYYPDEWCKLPCGGNRSEICGGGSNTFTVTNVTGVAAASNNGNGTVPKFPPIVPPNATSGYLGCYSDYDTVNAFSFTTTSLSPDICIRACAARNYTYSATFQGNRCRCGNTAPTAKLIDTDCETPCIGAPDGSICGSRDRISTYSIAASKIPALGLVSALPPAENTTQYIGCFTDDPTSILKGYTFKSDSMTPLLCQAACKEFGYTLAGISAGYQCDCSNMMDSSAYSGWQTLNTDCYSNCKGDATKYCGGGNDRLSVYASLAGPVRDGAARRGQNGYLGCYYNDAYTSAAKYSKVDSVMTPTFCRRICNNRGIHSSAVYSGKCWCSTSNLGLGSIVPESQCALPCPGDLKSGTTCGGKGTLLSVYNSTGVTYTVAKTGKGYVGCFRDSYHARILTGYSVASNDTTTAKNCLAICSGKGYKLAGTENGNQCFCGNSVGEAIQLSDDLCSTPCNGDTGENCGGISGLSLYDSALAVMPVAARDIVAGPSVSIKDLLAEGPTSTSTAAIGRIERTTVKSILLSSQGLLGCFTDSTSTASPSVNKSPLTGETLTPGMCKGWCNANGYTLAAVSSGNTCGCGDLFAFRASSSSATLKVAPWSSCAKPCTGNASIACGGVKGVYNLYAAIVQ